MSRRAPRTFTDQFKAEAVELVSLHRRGEGELPGGLHVQAARRLAQRPLRGPRAQAFCARLRGREAARGGEGGSRAEQGHLRQPASACRVDDEGAKDEPQAHLQAHVRGGAGRPQEATLPAHHRLESCIPAGRERPQSGFLRIRTEPCLGHRHHLPRHARGLAVPRGHRGPGLPPSRRLGHEGTHRPQALP